MTRCPDNHPWYRCAHPELSNPGVGILLIILGALQVTMALAVLLRA